MGRFDFLYDRLTNLKEEYQRISTDIDVEKKRQDAIKRRRVSIEDSYNLGLSRMEKDYVKSCIEYTEDTIVDVVSENINICTYDDLKPCNDMMKDCIVDMNRKISNLQDSINEENMWHDFMSNTAPGDYEKDGVRATHDKVIDESTRELNVLSSRKSKFDKIFEKVNKEVKWYESIYGVDTNLANNSSSKETKSALTSRSERRLPDVSYVNDDIQGDFEYES